MLRPFCRSIKTCLMIKHNIGCLPVVENGRVIGIVTRSDTMRYLYDLLPE
ncbi:MAG: CBS domain-containing protein [Proteobacteria bacterium]|nr:CBS domain-containing protein [Pseudomonadota bacterium]